MLRLLMIQLPLLVAASFVPERAAPDLEHLEHAGDMKIAKPHRALEFASFHEELCGAELAQIETLQEAVAEKDATIATLQALLDGPSLPQSLTDGPSPSPSNADSCTWANDGYCDEPTYTNDSCQYANDGDCDVPALCSSGDDTDCGVSSSSSSSSSCCPGTDTTDCGGGGLCDLVPDDPLFAC